MESCPHHHISPTVVTFTARESVNETYIDGNGQTRKYVLPKLTVYKIFCPLCEKSEVSTKFGTGYSAPSEIAAKKRWNTACLNEKLKMFKNAVKAGH